MQADLPILSPAIANMFQKFKIKQSKQLAIVDAGGNATGTTVLAALADYLQDKKEICMLQVINPMRPFTHTIKECLSMRAEIEKVSGIQISGIIGNTNLIDETTIEDIYRGYEFVKLLSRTSGLELKFITVPQNLWSLLDHGFNVPVLKIKRHLTPPWIK